MALFPCWSFHLAMCSLPGSACPTPLVNRKSITFLLLHLHPGVCNLISSWVVVVSSMHDPGGQFAMLSVMRLLGNCKWAVLSTSMWPLPQSAISAALWTEVNHVSPRNVSFGTGWTFFPLNLFVDWVDSSLISRQHAAIFFLSLNFAWAIVANPFPFESPSGALDLPCCSHGTQILCQGALASIHTIDPGNAMSPKPAFT